ncbi:MAG: rhomboid family intramembrane serine protease [Planctomycetales bacterium]|nr:rhomboid family intramembrane serine protease [Planctomycetales bacterium]
MTASILLFLAGSVAVLAAWSVVRHAPRGAGGALLQWGVLAGLCFWLVWRREARPFAVAVACGAVAALLVVPWFLAALAAKQIEIGRPGPVRAILLLRALVSWHRRHVLDFLAAPVRVAIAAGDATGAVAAARTLRGRAWLRGLEAESFEPLAHAFGAADRWRELLAEPGLEEAAARLPRLLLVLGRARAEGGDFTGARDALAQAERAGERGRALDLAWSHLLALAGDGPGLERWLAETRLGADPRRAGLLEALRERARGRAGAAAPPPEPPFALVRARAEDRTAEEALERSGPATQILLGGVVLSYLGLALAGAPDDPGLLVAAGAMVPPFIRAGEWWRLLSSALLHAGLPHLLLNGLALLWIGKVVEGLFGARLAVALFVVTAVAGGVPGLLGGERFSVGASGAICGWLGAAVAALFREPPNLPHEVATRTGARLLGTLPFLLGFGLLVPNVDNAAHVAGLAAGVLLGRLLPPARVARRPLGTGALVLAAASAVLGLLAVGFAIASLARGGGAPPLPRVAVQGPTGTLLVPSHWTSEREGRETVFRDGALPLQVVVGEGSRPLETIAKGALRDYSSVALGPPDRLPTGVERIRASGSKGDARATLLAFRATRDDRTAYLWGAGPGSVPDRVYGDLLADLAAQATPR